MAVASGVAKKLRFKEEASWGVIAPDNDTTYTRKSLRRVQSTLDMTKDVYQSNEIRSDYQVYDARHGVRKVAGNVNGEFSLGTYADLLAAALRYDWQAGSTFTSASGSEITTTANTVVRAGGSWITDGFKVGDVVRMSGSSVTANNAKNLKILSLTATVITVQTDALTLNATPETAVTVAVKGKKLWVPSTGHLDRSFTFEHFYSDIDESEQFIGCKVNTTQIGLPATGMMTYQAGIMGKDMLTTSGVAAPYFTSVAADTTTGILAAVNGSMRVAGTDVAVITGLQLNIDGGYTSEPVVGSNTVPSLVPGRVKVSGQFTAQFDSPTFRNAFINETEISLYSFIEAAGTDPKDFLGIGLERIKLGGAQRDDGEKAIVGTYPFTALLSTGGAGTAFNGSTIVLQDSTL
ncbi:phage tail tube protein (plasmid) [Azospirillum sp. HJ39]|uniref:phage tail tube protein n=1 Tax=Azospirillum sp. HJ39 TaxID=3159496 RepID=UPI0035562EE6